MKNILFYTFFTTILYSTEKPHFAHQTTNSNLAEQWATYTIQKNDSSKLKRNRLNDDPEQKSEHMQEDYNDLVSQLRLLTLKVEHTTSQKELSQTELACRVIAQAFLHLYDAGNATALAQANTAVFQLAAHIKLLQDPFWHIIAQNVIEKKKSALPPRYSTEEIERELHMSASKKDLLILLLLKQLEERQDLYEHISTEAVQELALAVETYKKPAEKIISRLAKIENNPLRIKTRPRFDNVSVAAKRLYSDAYIAKISIDAQYLQLKVIDGHRYPQLEAAYEAAALTFIKAHDAGHPNALKKAEKIMTMPLMDVIMRWKKRHQITDYAEIYLNICKEINLRKNAHVELIPLDDHHKPDASSEAASSSAPPGLSPYMH